MIPKIIHWCWLSNDEIPKCLAQYMQTWDYYLPEYKKIHWSLSNFNINKSIWVKEAFENKKYAFAADYIRLFALYEYGGFYLDMDVEVTKNFDTLLKLPIVICWQKDIGGLEVAAFGVQPKSPIIKTVLERYEDRHFIKNKGEFDTEVLPIIFEKTLLEYGYRFVDVNTVDEALSISDPNIIPVFQCDFFSPKSYLTGRIEKTINTFSIHHFEGSWLPKYIKVEQRFWNFIGFRNKNIIYKVKTILSRMFM